MIFKCQPHFSFELQVKTVIVCYILHYYIVQVDLIDRLIHEEININDGPKKLFDEGMVYNT